MDNKTFERSAWNFINKCLVTMFSKNASYNHDNDKLANFKASARCQGLTPEQVCINFAEKHRESIYNTLVAGINRGEPLPSDEWVKEKLGDMINYMLLLNAIIEERREKESWTVIREPSIRDKQRWGVH